jgi:hypothetical protein
LLINKSPFKKTSCFLVVVAAVVCWLYKKRLVLLFTESFYSMCLQGVEVKIGQMATRLVYFLHCQFCLSTIIIFRKTYSGWQLQFYSIYNTNNNKNINLL